MYSFYFYFSQAMQDIKEVELFEDCDEESDVDQDEVIENLMNLELDNECKIIAMLKFPMYDECCHADSTQNMDEVRCPRCELCVTVTAVEMPQNETDKHEFDVSYIQDETNIKRLRLLIDPFVKKN